MIRLRTWIVAALVVYNGLVCAANLFVLVFDPTEIVVEHVDLRTGLIIIALINLCLLAALIYTLRREPSWHASEPF